MRTARKRLKINPKLIRIPSFNLAHRSRPRKDRKRGRKRKADGVTSLVSGWSYALPSQSQAATPRDARCLMRLDTRPPLPPHRAINFDVRTVERCTYTRPAAEYLSYLFSLSPSPHPFPSLVTRVSPPLLLPPLLSQNRVAQLRIRYYTTINRLTVERLVSLFSGSSV